MLIPTWFQDRAGQVYLNELKRYVKNSILVPLQAQLPVVIAAAPSATIPTFGAPVPVEGSQDSVSIVYALVGEHDAGILAAVQNRMTVDINDYAFRRGLMNRPILVNHIFGNNLQPFFLNEGISLETQQTLNFQFFNNSTAGPTSFRFALHGSKAQTSCLANKQVSDLIFETRRRKTFLTPFWLTSDIPIALAAAGAAGDRGTFFFSVTKDIFFFAMSTMAQVITAGALTGDDFEFELFDSKTQRPIQNQPVTQSCGTGTARFPYQLPNALVCEPRMNITMKIRNLNAAAIEVFFTFAGVSVFASEQDLYRTLESKVQVATPAYVSAGQPW